MSDDGQRLDIPIFPLENVVLFPRVQVPLHIFEPRYRQMAREAIDGDGRIGMVVVRPDQQGGMQGNPDVFAIGCAGEIQRADELPGGRFNIVLAGTSRFEILKEDPPEGERMYRRAEVSTLEDLYPEDDRPVVLALRGEVHDLMRQLLTIVAPDRVEMFEQQPIAQMDDESFVNALSQSIDFAPQEKQALIESDAVRQRYERLAEFMQFRLAELTSGGSSGPGVVH